MAEFPSQAIQEAFQLLATLESAGGVTTQTSISCVRAREVAGSVLSGDDPKEIGGRYQVLARIGEGGMGIVYAARDRVLERTMAIKVLRTGLKTHRERFLREARAMARIDHPSVVKVQDVVREGGLDYIVMDFVRGVSLERILTEGGSDRSRLLGVLEMSARAVHRAHELGVLHRDLKPANILITEDEEVRLIDFGVSRFLDGTEETLTRSGVVLGTPQYMAPEQLAGEKDVGAPADVYSLGVILYRILAGRVPHTESNLLRVLQQKALGTVTPPSQLQSDIPPELERVTLKAMKMRPDLRYASALAFADDLARFRRGERPLAVSRGSGRRSSKRMRGYERRSRLPTPIALVGLTAALAVLLVLLGLAVTAKPPSDSPAAGEETSEIADSQRLRGATQAGRAPGEGELSRGEAQPPEPGSSSVESGEAGSEPHGGESEVGREPKEVPTVGQDGPPGQSPESSGWMEIWMEIDLLVGNPDLAGPELRQRLRSPANRMLAATENPTPGNDAFRHSCRAFGFYCLGEEEKGDAEFRQGEAWMNNGLSGMVELLRVRGILAPK